MLDMPGSARINDPDAPGHPQPSQGRVRSFGGNRAADVLRGLYIPDHALNPGASFRGLHDNLVNHLGSDQPRMLPCLHEEPAVAPAHCWAKVADPPMAALNDTLGHAMDTVLATAAATVGVRVLPGCGTDMQGAPTKEAHPDRG